MNNLPRVGTPPRADESSNPRPLNRKSNVLSFATTPPRRYHEIQHLAEAKFYSIISSDYFFVNKKLSYRRVTARYLSKVADFDPPQLHFAPPYGVTPVEFRRHLSRRKKLDSMGYRVVFFM